MDSQSFDPIADAYNKLRVDMAVGMLTRAAGGNLADRPILDFGCGNLSLVSRLRAVNADAIGCDIAILADSPWSRRGGVEFIEAQEPGSRWAVVALNVMPSLTVHEQRRFHAAVRRILPPDGVLLLSNPNPARCPRMVLAPLVGYDTLARDALYLAWGLPTRGAELGPLGRLVRRPALIYTLLVPA